MKKNIFIHSFHPVLPKHHLPQSETVDWILEAHQRSAHLLMEEELPREKLRRFCLTDKHIRTRYFECSDVNEEWSKHDIYKLTQATPRGAQIGERNHFFANRAEEIFGKLYPESSPSHLIHVTCTGYVSPSPAQEYFQKKVSPPEITHAYHMGCYASLPAIRMAMGLHLLKAADIDVVHTEMCSLHLDSAVHTPEQLVVQTLFADGHIKYTIGSSEKGMRILSVKEKLIPDTLKDMTWVPDAHGMKMTLSREVPFKIRDALPIFVHELCQDAGVQGEEVIRQGLFAIHPGGPKIIEAVQKRLELTDDQVRIGQRVLCERGNMSSATLPHVWKEMMDTKPLSGTKVLSLAFGPGLTIFGAVFEVV
jgi:predicted naringenin-chalcone synthase